MLAVIACPLRGDDAALDLEAGRGHPLRATRQTHVAVRTEGSDIASAS